tara:strand:+ start:711 stop:1232 length:522 start_codon:yes stop_codon:yes gene_type:complete
VSSNYQLAHACENYAKALFGAKGFEIFEAPESHAVDFLIRHPLLSQYYGVQVKSSSYRTKDRSGNKAYVFDLRRCSLSIRANDKNVVSKQFYDTAEIEYFVLVANDLIDEPEYAALLVHSDIAQERITLSRSQFIIQAKWSWQKNLKIFSTEDINTSKKSNPQLSFGFDYEGS